MKLGKTIQRIRQDKGMTQEQLAEATGLDRTTISRIENGHIETAIWHVYKIADALEVKTKELFNYE